MRGDVLARVTLVENQRRLIDAISDQVWPLCVVVVEIQLVNSPGTCVESSEPIVVVGEDVVDDVNVAATRLIKCMSF